VITWLVWLATLSGAFILGFLLGALVRANEHCAHIQQENAEQGRPYREY
jgi:hypothetical protein